MISFSLSLLNDHINNLLMLTLLSGPVDRTTPDDRVSHCGPLRTLSSHWRTLQVVQNKKTGVFVCLFTFQIFTGQLNKHRGPVCVTRGSSAAVIVFLFKSSAEVGVTSALRPLPDDIVPDRETVTGISLLDGQQLCESLQIQGPMMETTL